MALIDHVDWSELDRRVIRQQRNRSAHTPVISLYRWWARRSHYFAGALLDAARKQFRRKEFLVADPFSGGGTVAFEAARRGLTLYAQDLYPWPSNGLATALTRTDPEEFRKAAKVLLESLAPFRKKYCSKSGEDVWEITHIIRVRSSRCPGCSKPFFLFREPMISLASRRADESHAFFGCTACGAVNIRKKTVKVISCDECKACVKCDTKSTSDRYPAFLCPHCSKSFQLSELLLSTIDWHPVLLREHCLSSKKGVARIRIAEHGDPVEDLRRSDRHPLHIEIPNGVETRALKGYGFRFWDELYTQRQLDIISSAIDGVSSIKATPIVKKHLLLAILGTSEMAGYVCRWERYHPKALEAIANHRFSRATVAVETNLLSISGRGTLPRRFGAVARALRWMWDTGYPIQTIHAESTARRRGVRGALVVTGSSERQLLQNGAALLVFTDPPYHDDLQYGELARLFHAWMIHAGSCKKPPEGNEAVPNAVRGVTTEDYEDKVACCLRESRRALSLRGRLVLTFHNKDLDAWEALAQALARSGFDVVRLATVAAENSADHSKRGKRSFLSDLVIECKPKAVKRQRSWRLEVRGATHRAERKNLAAIGLALAELVNRGQGDIEELFNEHMKRLRARKKLIRRGGR